MMGPKSDITGELSLMEDAYKANSKGYETFGNAGCLGGTVMGFEDVAIPGAMATLDMLRYAPKFMDELIQSGMKTPMNSQLGAIGTKADDLAQSADSLPVYDSTPSSTHIETVSNYDPGFTHQVGSSSNRVGEMRDYLLNVERDNLIPPSVSIADYEGRPYMISMADRTAGGGHLYGVNGVDFDSPVALEAGQDFMLEHPGKVWASAPEVIAQMDAVGKRLYAQTGQNPLFLPWRMTPKGGDFSHMNAETMLKYAKANMPPSEIKAANKAIQQVMPQLDISDPRTFALLGDATGDQRKAVQLILDRDFRDRGGLSVTGARLGVADPYQLRAPTGGLQNIGEVFAGKDVIYDSGHSTYKHALPGRGIGRLEEDIPALDLVPELRERNYGNYLLDPYHQDDAFARSRRSLETNLYTGILDEKTIRLILDAQ